MSEAIEAGNWRSEPPCWGSAEIGLLPKSWERLMGRHTIQIVTRIKKSGVIETIPASLGNFSRSSWSASWYRNRRSKGGRPLLEQVIDEVRSRFNEMPDLFDIPITAGHVIGETKSMGLPFLVSTWQKLEDLGLDNSQALDSLFDGTFLDAFELLNKDVKALLDITVTGSAWVDDSRRASMVFRNPQQIESVESFLQQTCLRSYRNVGIDPGWGQYSDKYAQVFPKRWGITPLSRYTLESAGKELSITRERARQLEERFPIIFEPRRWPLPSMFVTLQHQLGRGNEKNFTIVIGDVNELSRAKATQCLIACGVQSIDLEPFGGVDVQLKKFGLDLNFLNREAFVMSGRIGVLFREQFFAEITERWPSIPLELLEAAIKIFATYVDLPYGYIFVENKSKSYLRTDLETVLSRNGALEFDELYLALVRYFRYRTPGTVFPPAIVIQELLVADDKFEIDGKFVSVLEPVSRHLGDSYEWMWETISNSPGMVIHRTELLEKCREYGLNSSTMQVYFAYSLCFKQVRNNCVTLTGHQPSNADIEYARVRASLVTIPTKILNWNSSGNCVDVNVRVGNSLLDTGLLSLPVVIRKILGGTIFEIYWGDEKFGSARWSKVVNIGWSTVLRKGSVSVGDQILISFDLVRKTAQVAMAEDLDEGVLNEVADVEF